MDDRAERVRRVEYYALTAVTGTLGTSNMRIEDAKMAHKDKQTYDSYTKDVFDNPPAGPLGVHRGSRSAASRALPYVVVIIVAMLAGLLFWGIYSGELSNVKLPWSSQESSSTTTSSKHKQSTDATKKQSDANNDSASSGTSTDTQDQSASSSDAESSSSDDAAGNAAGTDTESQAVNHGTQIRVLNATSISGYAKSKADVLSQAGYTSVSASNPTGTVPSQTVVWYQNETDKATAENVAQTLGISNVQQSDGIVTPIVVVLLD